MTDITYPHPRLPAISEWHVRSRPGLVVIGATEAQARRSWPHAGTILVAVDLDEAAVLLRELPRGARVVVRTGPVWQFLCSARTRTVGRAGAGSFDEEDAAKIMEE